MTATPPDECSPATTNPAHTCGTPPSQACCACMDEVVTTQSVEALQAEIDRLRAGSEAPDDVGSDNAYPSPAQWISRFLAAPADWRLEYARWSVGNSRAAGVCLTLDHEGELGRLRAQLTGPDGPGDAYERALRAQVDRMEAEVHRLRVELVRVAEPGRSLEDVRAGARSALAVPRG